MENSAALCEMTDMEQLEKFCLHSVGAHDAVGPVEGMDVERQSSVFFLCGWVGSAWTSVHMSCLLPLLLAAYLWYCRINRSLVGSTGEKWLDVLFWLERCVGSLFGNVAGIVF